MVVLSILGVVTALALPALLPLIKGNRLLSAPEAIAGFVDTARRRAIYEGRCTRVRQVATTLVLDVRDSGDCVNLDKDGWVTASTFRLEPELSVVTDAATIPLNACCNNASHHIIFRPSGRLWGDGDLRIDDDGARVIVSVAGLAQTRSVDITANGRICVTASTGTPAPLGSAVTCD